MKSGKDTCIYLQSQNKLYSLFDSFCPYNISTDVAKNLEPMSNEQENC